MTSTRRINILIQVDIDSTLYDADKLFDQLAREQGIKWPRRAPAWFHPTEIVHDDGSPCSVDELKKVFRKAHSAEYVMQQKPYPYAATALEALVNKYDDIEIAYVSDRNSQQTNALREWLDEHGFLYSDDIYIQATKDKRHWMRERRPEIVIDDRVRTILMARFELGSYVVSLEHAHNINLRGEVDHIYIVKDWRAIEDVLSDEVIPKLQEKAVSKTLELPYV